MITLLLLVRATYMYGVVLHAHPVRGESHNQRNTTGEVATRVDVLEKVKTILYFILVIHQQWLMKSIFVKKGRILGKFTKGA